VLDFVAAVLDPGNRPFHDELQALAREAARVGMRISLGTLVLKLTAPGVPDIYWGNELLDLSLVDPDNRRPVDFAGRRGPVAELAAATEADLPGLCRELAGDLAGRAKLHLTVRGLDLRRRRARLFAEGEYVPLCAAGPRAGDIVAFARRHGQEWVVAAAPRFGDPASGWEATRLALPAEAPVVWTDAVSGVRHEGCDLPAGALFDGLGVALLEPADDGVAERSKR